MYIARLSAYFLGATEDSLSTRKREAPMQARDYRARGLGQRVWDVGAQGFRHVGYGVYRLAFGGQEGGEGASRTLCPRPILLDKETPLKNITPDGRRGCALSITHITAEDLRAYTLHVEGVACWAYGCTVSVSEFRI